MNKTKIDWCDSTWNPVTGCFNDCEYCYARNIAERFGGSQKYANIYDLAEPIRGEDGKAKAYPYSFSPTFHRYRLNDYIDKKGRNIFVCSMADLFSSWVPDAWIEEVFKACEKAPQHNYLFLTKNQTRYEELYKKGIIKTNKNMWYGFTCTKNDDCRPFYLPGNVFVSIEPILERIFIPEPDWVIVGAETGRRKGKVIPKREWIERIVEDCREYDIPLFMKSSLADIWNEPLIQEFPKVIRK